jgi:hypothetical protein
LGRVVVGGLFDRLGERPPGWPEIDSSVLLHEDERAFHVHGGGDELKMAGGAGEPAIPDAAHAVPLLHRGVSALDAAADARGPGIDQPLPIFEWMMGPPAPRHAVDQTAPSERLAKAWLL